MKEYLPDKVKLETAFASFAECWSPKIVGEVNDMHVKLAKLHGEFVWHHHEHEDEMFLVVKGSLLMHFRDGDVQVDTGDFIIVPRGVEHKPEAREETWVMLVEPASTRNTGNVRNERTVDRCERIPESP
jgi:mannose-6-phosphate isomerase-like protein (cupin superfamily)